MARNAAVSREHVAATLGVTGRITTHCSRRRAAGAGFIHRGHAPAAAERER